MINHNIAKLLSNYINRFFSVFSVFVFVPFYIKILGIENYAIIGFYTLLLGVISFADMGMSSAIIKEFSLEESATYKYSVFRNIENLYLLICLIILTIILLNTNSISKYWLNSNTLKITELSHYIFLIGIGTVLQLLSSLYFGAFFGLGEQVRANFFSLIWSFCRMGIVILVLKFFRATLEIYFIWQIICNILYILLLRFNILILLKKQDKNIKNYLKRIPKHIINYVGGMTVIAIISAVNSQADKIITTSFFSLKTFGYYNIASILSQMPVMLGTPLSLFVFPIFSKYVNSDIEKLKLSFNKITFLLSIIIFPIISILFFFPEEILKLWTGKAIDYNVFPMLAYITRMLLIGSLFLALQLPFFYYLLSKGKTKYTIYQGFTQVFIGIPLLYICAKYYGVEAVPIPWIIINFGSFVYLVTIVFSRYFNLKFRYYFFNTIVVPLLICLLVAVLFYSQYKNHNNYVIIYIVLIYLFSLILCIVINNILHKRSIIEFKHLYNFPK